MRDIELPTYSVETPTVCCITLNEWDKIRLIDAPVNLRVALRKAIVASWGPIQREQDYNGAHEFKLKGNPWSGQGEEAVKARRLITAVLRAMAMHGWNLIQATDISKKQHDKDSLFFEPVVVRNLDGSVSPTTSTAVVEVGHADMFAVSFNRTDRIRLIDAPEHLRTLLRNIIMQQWKKGIQLEQFYDSSAYEYKLSGSPFFTTGAEAVYIRLLLAKILACFREQGFKLYTSVDISTGHDGMDVESWVFRRVGPAWS
ncbi:hypothetical protein BGZ65_006859 [Modicella reniformis]|uniref:Uncharacterized protein n=1 Tax=Modicella reniformis TaxID=1440133 RepID=A0A9P6LXW5_9FUNG|nr:hypothetical protein BGZ65_006859 [Modicella reniformis]